MFLLQSPLCGREARARGQQDVEKVRQRYRKVKAEAKAEMKKVRSSLNLDLDLSQFRAAILRAVLLLSYPLCFSARWSSSPAKSTASAISRIDFRKSILCR